MVAKITTPHTILRALNYNEKKVQKGQAECIHAGNFLMDLKDMNFYDKLNTFKNLIELNSRAKTNTLHISLNFDPSEKLGNEKLIELSSVYMDKIGFGKQPFLIYLHQDAGHPHIHIVTTSIQEDGKRINTYNIGRNQSEKARKEIEERYGLVKAKGRNFRQVEGIEPVSVQKVKYGLSETKRSITNVLDAVVNKYKYTSLAELNAVLKLYNVLADRGSEEGRIYRHRGLNYRILDEKGNKVGMPVKASSIYSKPTLNFLEEKFKQNEQLREPYKQKLKTAIDWTLANKPNSLADFVLELQREKINAIMRRNEQGFIYGVTFIDHRSKCIFNGSDLGKSYSAAAIKERLEKGLVQKEKPATSLLQKQMTSQKINETNTQKDLTDQQDKSRPDNTPSKAADLLHQLLKSDKNEHRLPYELLRKKKKKRKFNL